MRKLGRDWLPILVTLGFITIIQLTITFMYLQIRTNWQETNDHSLILNLAKNDIQWLRLEIERSNSFESPSVQVRIEQAVERYHEAMTGINQSFPLSTVTAQKSLDLLIHRLSDRNFLNLRGLSSLLTQIEAATQLYSLQVSLEIKRYHAIQDRWFLVILWLTIGFLIFAAHRSLRIVDQKEKLLRELQHRTNNTLQILQSWIQMKIIDDESMGSSQILHEVYNRSSCMALASRLVNQDPQLSAISIKAYVTELVEDFSYDSEFIKSNITLGIEDSFLLIDYIVPLGLIIAELLQYTRYRGNQAEIQIGIDRQQEGRLVFTYSDSLPFQDFHVHEVYTTVKALAEHQLGGEFQNSDYTGEIDQGSFTLAFSFLPKGYDVRL